MICGRFGASAAKPVATGRSNSASDPNGAPCDSGVFQAPVAEQLAARNLLRAKISVFEARCFSFVLLSTVLRTR